MPIVRTYACEQCNHLIEVTLAAEQWDDPAPNCPDCASRAMQQQFRPVAITGSPSARANAIAEDIIANDYKVADINRGNREGDVPKVRYKDEPLSLPSGNWGGVQPAALQQAIASGRQNRLEFGSGLDVLQANIKNGSEPDLLEISKRRAMKVW